MAQPHDTIPPDEQGATVRPITKAWLLLVDAMAQLRHGRNAECLTRIRETRRTLEELGAADD